MRTGRTPTSRTWVLCVEGKQLIMEPELAVEPQRRRAAGALGYEPTDAAAARQRNEQQQGMQRATTGLTHAAGRRRAGQQLTAHAEPSGTVLAVKSE